MIRDVKTVAEAALYYISLGFAVFPVHRKLNGQCTCNNPDCRSPGKHPRTQNGVKDATKDPAIVNYWWNSIYRGSGIAIATGRVSGFFIVDVDKKDLGDLAWHTFKDDNDIDDTETPIATTINGGHHVFYRMPAEGKVKTDTNVLAKGIDIRGDGGYIVAYPSDGYDFILEQAVGELEIEEAPESILSLVIKKEIVDRPLTKPDTRQVTLHKGEVDKIKSALAFVDSEDYSVWWSIGAALHSTNDPNAFDWWCEWSEQSDKYDHQQQINTWNNFDARKGATDTAIDIDYLYSEAYKVGWQETFDHSDVDIESFNVTNDEFHKLGKEQQKVDKPLETFTARTIDGNFSPEDIPIRKWLITNVLLAGYINLLVSPGAVGKSMITLVEAISVATGIDLLGLGQVQQGKVLVINNEDDDNELNRRVCAICQYYGVDIKLLEGQLFIRSGYSDRVLITSEINRAVAPSMEVIKLINFIKDNSITLVTIDPFVSTHECSENDNSNIDTVIQYFKQIAGITGAAIRLVHHTRKTGGEADHHAGDIESARGASSLKDAARSCHTLARMGNSCAKEHCIDEDTRLRLIRFDSAKNNFSLPDSEATWFYIKSVKIANGETLGVPRPYNLEPTSKQEKISPEKRKANTIHDIGQAALAKLGVEGGKIKAAEIKGDYMNFTGYKSSRADNDFTLLPIGTAKAERIQLKGNFYRICQTKDEKRTAPRYIHLYPEK